MRDYFGIYITTSVFFSCLCLHLSILFFALFSPGTGCFIPPSWMQPTTHQKRSIRSQNFPGTVTQLLHGNWNPLKTLISLRCHLQLLLLHLQAPLPVQYRLAHQSLSNNRRLHQYVAQMEPYWSHQTSQFRILRFWCQHCLKTRPPS